jgi:hypothetical protein
MSQPPPTTPPLDKPSLLTPPHPWEYNPSKWSQRVIIAIVATPAALIAAYMALYQWRLIDTAWDPIFGEQTMKVLDSDVSHRMWGWFLIPDAALGALAYLGDMIFALAGSTRRWQYRPWLVMIFGLDVIPLGIVSAVLVVMQATVVGEWCFLCLITAAISLILVWLAYDEVWSCLIYLRRYWQRTRSWKKLWWTIWGWPSIEAHEVGREVARERGEKWGHPQPPGQPHVAENR